MTERRGSQERFLTSVLMTDIVGSTEHAAELGDAAWRELVQLHHAVVRAALRRHDGREIDTAGDGFFAIFDAPAAAVACALDIGTAVKELGLEVRAGVHVGEVEQIGRKVGGIAVPIAARIMAAAGASEVLVSSTVRDLVAGARFTFEDRGAQALKGVPGEWHVYAATRAEQSAGETRESARAEEAASRRAAAVRRVQSRPIWRRRPRATAFVAVAIAAVLAVSALLVFKPWQSPALAGIEEDSVGLVDAARGAVIASTKVGARPGGIAVGGGQIWVTNTGSDTVDRIDAGTRLVTREIDVGHEPTGIVLAGQSVWVANSGERSVTRVDAATARVVDTIVVGNSPTAMAAASGFVWVAVTGDSTVVRIDAATGKVGPPIPVTAGPVAIAANEEAVWVASADGAALTRIDPTTQVTVAAPLGLPSRAIALAIVPGAVWVATADGTVMRIDASSNRPTTTIDLGAPVSAAAATDSAVWFADSEGRLHRIDLANPVAPPTTVDTRTAPQSLAAGSDGNLWVATRAAASDHRGGTLRIFFEPLPALDPNGTPRGNATSLEADGLVGYARVGGVAGTTVLPDLATAVPEPTNGGLTYTFQLRPGLVYSNGEPVRAADFRRAIERSFQGAPTGFAPGNLFFLTITGAEACATEDATPVDLCDLSEGILTDDAANTVTFQLSEPDADFLFKLASPPAYPVPEGVPMNAEVEGVFPGTGPYVVASVSDNELRLQRNPNFHPWNTDVRPDGYVDEIVFTSGVEAERRVAMIANGEADFMAIRSRSDADSISPELAAQLRTQYPGQLHSGSTVTFAAYLNPSRPPFDNLQARQALSMAVDRAHVTELFSGAVGSSTTCQVLPPGILGYEPYCPFTSNPDAGGRWHSPDLEAAQRLVTESGTQGAHVVVGPALTLWAPVRDYLAEVLIGLGYETSIDERTDPDVFFGALDSADYQVMMGNSTSTWPAPTEHLLGFTCAQIQPGFICDTDFDELFGHAVGLLSSDPAAAAVEWAAADRYITDRAYQVSLVNPGTDFVSSRVGNYQFHPVYFYLWDQVWVQ
jgi:peptide/nickel transport system substrate-binding protein